MVTVIHLIRHGEVENPDGIRYGRLPGYPLSLRGQTQASAAGRYLATKGVPIAAILSSPLERATQTATLMQDQLGLASFATDERLIEATNLFDGLPKTAPLRPWNWKVWPNPFQPSWGEPFVEIARRMHAVIVEQRTEHRGAAVVLVSHQAPIWTARRAFESRRAPWLARVRCAHASITSLQFAGDRYLGHTYWAPG